MSEFSQDNDIKRIITLIKSSATNQDMYLGYLKTIARSKYKSYIDNQKTTNEDEVQEQEQEEVLKKTQNNFNPFPCIVSYSLFNIEYKLAYEHIIELIINNTSNEAEAQTYIINLKRITINCNSYIDTTYEVLKEINNLNNEYKKEREIDERE
jgi:hypothetical protein